MSAPTGSTLLPPATDFALTAAAPPTAGAVASPGLDKYGPPPSSSSTAPPPSAAIVPDPGSSSADAPPFERLSSQQPSNSNPSPIRSTQHPDDVFPISTTSERGGSVLREKLVPTSKIYVGGLPEDTLLSDMEACFSKSGRIVNIELKAGFGFVEFEHKSEADNAVETYHNGFFMGSQIKVEHSKGGGRTAKFQTEQGSCYTCGRLGHRAKDCTNASQGSAPRSVTPAERRTSFGSFRDAPPPPPLRDAPPPPIRDTLPPPRTGDGPIGGGRGYSHNFRPFSPPRSSYNNNSNGGGNRGGYVPPPPLPSSNNTRAPYDSYNDRPPPSAAFPAPGLRDGPPRDHGYYPPSLNSGPPPPSRDYYPPSNGNGAPLPHLAGRYDDRRDYRAPPPPQHQAPLPPPPGRYNDDRERMPSYRDEPPRRDFYGSGPPAPSNGGSGGYGSSSYGAPPPPPPRHDDYYSSAPAPRLGGGGYGAPPPSASYGGGRDFDRYGAGGGGGRGSMQRPLSPPIGRYGAPGGDRDAPAPVTPFGGGGGGGWTDGRATRREPSPPRGRSDFDASRYGAPASFSSASNNGYGPPPGASSSSARRRSLSPPRRYESGPLPPLNQGHQGPAPPLPPPSNGAGYDSRSYNAGGAGGYGPRGGNGNSNGMGGGPGPIGSERGGYGNGDRGGYNNGGR